MRQCIVNVENLGVINLHMQLNWKSVFLIEMQGTHHCADKQCTLQEKHYTKTNIPKECDVRYNKVVQ